MRGLSVEGLLAIRAIVFEYEQVASASASSRAQGLAAWFAGLGQQPVVNVDLAVYRITRIGVIAQRAGNSRVEVVWDPVIRFEELLDYMFCRHHEGVPGKPWEHEYCTRLASTRSGYCRLHSSSVKALYELCAQGYDRACSAIASSPEKFAVYALDYGGSRLKIGLTQSWRLMWRIAEQPHVSAAGIYEEGILGARNLEKKLGRQRVATEGSAVRLVERLRLSAQLASRLPAEAGRAASRLAAMLSGLGLNGSYSALSVMPLRYSPRDFTSIRQVGLEALEGRKVRIVDYWAGIVVIEDAEGSPYAIHKSELLHRAARGVIRGG